MSKSFVTFKNKHLLLDIEGFLKSPEGRASLEAVMRASRHFDPPHPKSLSKPRVNKLSRFGPEGFGGYSYYSPDGHCIGPFATEEEREKDIQEHYEEVVHENRSNK